MYPTTSTRGGTRATVVATTPPPEQAWSTRDTTRCLAVLMVSLLLACAAALLVFDQRGGAMTAVGKVRTCGGKEISLTAKEKSTFMRHNKIRSRHSLPTLCVNLSLQRAARHHSEDMITRDYFSHDTLHRAEGIQERIQSFGGGAFSTVAENIALGQGSSGDPDRIMRMWMDSPGHRRNILNGGFRQVGIGVHTGTWQGHRDVSMYTVDFGAR